MIRCLLFLVELFFIGLRLGDSHLVIPSLLFFAPFLFCNYSVVWLSLMFFSLFSSSCTFWVCSMFFMHRVDFRIYIILTYQKKTKKNSLLVGTNDCCFPWKSIWKQKIPSRVAFFVSTTALEK